MEDETYLHYKYAARHHHTHAHTNKHEYFPLICNFCTVSGLQNLITFITVEFLLLIIISVSSSFLFLSF